jgi:hypothetical protein
VRLKLADRNAGNDCIVEGAFNPQTLSPQCFLFVMLHAHFFHSGNSCLCVDPIHLIAPSSAVYAVS